MRELAGQFARFSGVGLIGTGAHYATLILLVQFAGIHPVAASSAGAIVGAFVNYYLNYQYTFRSNKRHHEALAKFFIVASIGFIVNGALMALFTELLRLHYLLAQVITTGTVLLVTFTGNRVWTFREKRHELGS